MPNVKSKTKYLRMTEESNAIDYLKRSGTFIKETENDSTAWKWVILSLHGALYGFAICACKGTRPSTVTSQNKKGVEKLITFDKALELCQDEKRMRSVCSEPLILTNSQKDTIKFFKNDLRNVFVHYIPKAWSIEISGLPQIAIELLSIIKFLALETRTCVQLNQSQKRKIKSIISQSTKILENLRGKVRSDVNSGHQSVHAANLFS